MYFVVRPLVALMILLAAAGGTIAAPAVGDDSPAIQLDAVINGAVGDYADLKGKVTFVEFWATW